MATRTKLKIPRSLKARLKAVGKAHDLGSTDDVALHFVDRGLRVYGATDGDIGDRIEQAVDSEGYSSADELIEHLLLRGLRAYEQADDDPAALAERLRGLGYID